MLCIGSRNTGSKSVLEVFILIFGFWCIGSRNTGSKSVLEGFFTSRWYLVYW